ncbi:MAG TPA: CDP-alcohol phosphatidyltransferase family protein [Dehalococcoidia bacterium]|nr:CDP-alcohol phosphatidyltransferase family protein [Dehalococcoidia bacterium]
MFTLLPHTLPKRLTEPVGQGLARTGVTPNMITTAGLAGAVVAAVLVARGEFLAGGIVMMAAAALDLLDGIVARASGRVTAFGGVFDSVCDRLSEAAVLGGLVFRLAGQGKREEVVLAFAAVVGSLMVSYLRARAEAAGLELREGLFTRPERVVVLGVGLIFGQVRIVLWILAVLANLTALQRLWVVRGRAVALDRERDGGRSAG